MPNGYATANLLRHVNAAARADDRLAPEVEAPRDLPPRDTEYPTLVTGLMMTVGLIALFAILIHDIDRRMNPLPPPVPEDVIAATLDLVPLDFGARPPARKHQYEVCAHMALTGTVYTYADCKVKTAAGKTVFHREGM